MRRPQNSGQIVGVCLRDPVAVLLTRDSVEAQHTLWTIALHLLVACIAVGGQAEVSCILYYCGRGIDQCDAFLGRWANATNHPEEMVA